MVEATGDGASVIVPSYGGALRLPVVLGALAQQQVRMPYEVVVVLDGTRDGSEAVARRFEPELPLRVIRFPENRGRSAALNAGFGTAKGRVLIRCDDDLRPGRDFVQRHWDWHGQDHVAVIGLYRNVYGDTPYANAWGKDANDQEKRAAYVVPAEWRWRLWAGNCSVGRSLWAAVGPYDEAFREYGWEDTDWGCRAQAAGATFVVDPDLETDHLAAADSAATRMERAFLSSRARAKFESKHPAVRWEEPPPPATLRGRLWRALLAAGGRGDQPKTYERRGRIIDRAGPSLPAPALARLISWGVESAGVAGYADGRRRMGIQA